MRSQCEVKNEVKTFNTKGFMAAVALAAATSLLLSLEDGQLSALECSRAFIQGTITALAFLAPSRSPQRRRKP